MPDFASACGARCSRPFECAEKQLPCVTLGPLIHNPQEVERLRRAGIRSVETLDEVDAGRDGHHPQPWRDAGRLSHNARRAAFP